MAKLRLFLWLWLPLMAFSQTARLDDAERGRIISLENAWNQAEQQKDINALELLLAPELIYVEFDGTLMTKPQYMASVQSADIHATHIVSESMSVSIYGNVAVVNGIYRESGVKDGKPFALRERFIDTWIRHSGSWMCVASQSTLISR
ncbi:MAG TPA: nuclear transport factor 2 family protein [Candidatus Binatia bacterium]|nr:nuclear transport factor 2 family protein [Candidatus Binatia bacterium]